MDHTHISAEHRLLDLKLGEVWRYRELIFLFAERSIQVSYKQTVLGPLWLFLNPLLTSIFFVVLFGNIAKLSTDGVPQLVFYMSGLALWNFFSGRVSANSATFTGNAHLFGKVYFPRLVVPLSDIVSGAVRFGIQMLLVIVIYAYYFVNGLVSPNVLALLSLPLVVVVLGLMGMGVGIIVSSFTTRYRDLSVLVSFGLQLWMYATPVAYPLSAVDGVLRTILSCNPVTAPMELFRFALFDVGTVSAPALLYSLLFALGVTVAGIAVFNKVERTFMDTV